MNSIVVAFFLCLAAMVSGNAWVGNDDGQWRGEGLVESQDWAGRSGWGSHGSVWGSPVSTWAAPASAWAAPQVWGSGVLGAGVVAPIASWSRTWPEAHIPAPLDHAGNVVDTPAVAHAKAAHLITKAARGSHDGVWGAGWTGYGHGAW